MNQRKFSLSAIVMFLSGLIAAPASQKIASEPAPQQPEGSSALEVAQLSQSAAEFNSMPSN